jgi:hypothetical protein
MESAMSPTTRCRLFAVLSGGLLVLLALVWLDGQRRSAMRDAEAQAAIRLLHEFHAEYLSKRGIDLEDYAKAFASFADRHKGLPDLERYEKAVSGR